LDHPSRNLPGNVPVDLWRDLLDDASHNRSSRIINPKSGYKRSSILPGDFTSLGTLTKGRKAWDHLFYLSKKA
jgi:hypothetical protein